ncbi:hypothetical protein CRG98_025317, partial [Punica granatum]
MALVRRVWTEAQEGTPMEVLYKKLRSLKMHLKDFNRTKFGNVHTRINDLQSELAQVQATLLDSDYEEIKAALFSMGNDKSPRPDGYTAYFFKHAWQIVQKDFTNVVQHFFSSGKLRRE